jgi:hypothetical protein
MLLLQHMCGSLADIAGVAVTVCEAAIWDSLLADRAAVLAAMQASCRSGALACANYLCS